MLQLPGNSLIFPYLDMLYCHILYVDKKRSLVAFVHVYFHQDNMFIMDNNLEMILYDDDDYTSYHHHHHH